MQVPGTLGTVSWGHWNPLRGWRHQAERGGRLSPATQQSSDNPAGWGRHGARSGNRTACPGVRPDNELPQPGGCARRRRAPEGAPLLPFAHPRPGSCPARIVSPHARRAQSFGDGRKAPCAATLHPRLSLLGSRCPSQKVTGVWVSLRGLLSLMPLIHAPPCLLNTFMYMRKWIQSGEKTARRG